MRLRRRFSGDEEEMMGREVFARVALEAIGDGDGVEFGEVFFRALLDVESYYFELRFLEQFAIIRCFESVEGHERGVDPAFPGLGRVPQMIVLGETTLHVGVKVLEMDG